MTKRPPKVTNRLLVLLGVVILCVTCGRLWRDPSPEAAIAFGPAAQSDICWIEVARPGKTSKFYRFSEPPTGEIVIKMANLPSGLTLDPIRKWACNSRLEWTQNAVKGIEFKKKVIGPHARFALGIPLDIRSMAGEDWQALPGVGPALASRIERYRQENGDFSSPDALVRVRGIGKKRVQRWKSLFFKSGKP